LLKQKRKTFSLTVTPNLEIILKSPEIADKEKIEKFLQKKWFWLEKQLNFFKQYQRKTYEKQYVSGESFLYLGRQYKLIVKKGENDGIRLAKNQILLETTANLRNENHNKKMIDDWFAQKRTELFTKRFAEVLKLFKYKNDFSLAERDMKKRWGSILKQKKILLNPRLIHAPKYCIDYVIAHELCHVKYKQHDKKFYDLLENKYPGWQKVKDKLEMLGTMV
jgi:hypothetical protein